MCANCATQSSGQSSYAGEGSLEPHHLPAGFGSKQVKIVIEPSSPGNSIQVEVGATVNEAERRLIMKTLESTGNNKTRAAEILVISLKTLHNKLKDYVKLKEQGKHWHRRLVCYPLPALLVDWGTVHIYEIED